MWFSNADDFKIAPQIQIWFYLLILLQDIQELLSVSVVNTHVLQLHYTEFHLTYLV